MEGKREDYKKLRSIVNAGIGAEGNKARFGLAIDAEVV
jgi:hypothetical protein